jgi:hypothetical protein
MARYSTGIWVTFFTPQALGGEQWDTTEPYPEAGTTMSSGARSRRHAGGNRFNRIAQTQGMAGAALYTPGSKAAGFTARAARVSCFKTALRHSGQCQADGQQEYAATENLNRDSGCAPRQHPQSRRVHHQNYTATLHDISLAVTEILARAVRQLMRCIPLSARRQKCRW